MDTDIWDEEEDCSEEEKIAFEEYMEEIYDVNLLDLLEDVDLAMQDLSRAEVEMLQHKRHTDGKEAKA